MPLRFLPAQALSTLTLLLLSACAIPASGPSVPDVPLPPVQGSGDAGHQAVMTADAAFSDVRQLAERPAAAARASAQMEWMAATLPRLASWTETSPLLPGALSAGRSELRTALGIASNVPPDVAARGLLAAASALEAGQQAAALSALDPLAPGQGAQILTQLRNLPALPRTRFAASLARQEIFRVMSDE
jgi:hypothetical protein